MTQSATLIIEGQVVELNVPFQRIPMVGETIFYATGWTTVLSVAHNFDGASPVAQIEITAPPIISNNTSPPGPSNSTAPPSPTNSTAPPSPTESTGTTDPNDSTTPPGST